MAIRHNKSVGNLPWSPWKPPVCSFLLLMFCATISRGGCSCNIHNKNGSTLEFTNPDNLRVHAAPRGYQLISCRARNYCHIKWYRENQTAPNAIPLYLWDLGQFTVYSLEEGNQTLRFTSADKTAQGLYTCIVSNGTHEINRTTLLKVDEIFWNSAPLELHHRLCHNQTAVLGQNVSYLCQFYVGARVGQTAVYWNRPNETTPEAAGSECGKDWLLLSEVSEMSRYTAYHTRSLLRDAVHVSNFGNETPSVGSSLDVFNVSEEAYGLYCIIANNDGLWSRVVLMLSPPDKEPRRPNYRKLSGMVVASTFILAAFSCLIWKIVALDVKVWYQSHFGDEERNDGKVYDVYLSYSWTDTDRRFVLSVIMPYLERFGYRLFIPEIHTVPSNVLLEELSRAMESSRRCIMLITPDYTTSEFSKYEVEIAVDVMSSKLSERIIPVFLGVSPCTDPSPLYGSEPSLSSASSSSSSSSAPSSSQPSSLSSELQTGVSFESISEVEQDGPSSIVSSCSSTSSAPPASLSSTQVKINFNFSPLLGQLFKVLKPLNVNKKEPIKLENYNRFLKRLRLRMPKPPDGKPNPTIRHEMETVSHTGNLVDNEELPEGSGVDAGIRMQAFPRLYPVVPN